MVPVSDCVVPGSVVMTGFCGGEWRRGDGQEDVGIEDDRGCREGRVRPSCDVWGLRMIGGAVKEG
jgi:hypothetical protein